MLRKSSKNNEIKDIIKVIKSSEKRGILLKKKTSKITRIISRNVNSRCSYSKKNYGSGTTALIISNEEMEDIMKIVKSLEESVLLVKVISETTKNETKEQREGFLAMLLGTLAAILLGSTLTGKGAIQKQLSRGVLSKRCSENMQQIYRRTLM